MKRGTVFLEKLPGLLERYKYPALILLLGVFLVLWPSGRAEPVTQTTPETAASEPAPAEPDYRAEMERELAALLSQVDGAGQVKVMLTLKTGPSAQ